MTKPLVPTPALLKVEVDTFGGWADVTGPSTHVSINRADSEPGTAQVEVLDAGLDPRTTAAVRLGKAVRIRALIDGTWQSFYTGNLDNIEVTEDPLAPEGRQVNVKLTAVDNTATLANRPEDRGVATIDELRWLIGTAVPFRINGQTTTLAAGTVVARNENAGLWDQILVTRDSNLGHAWVDVDNQLVVNDPASMDTTVKATLTPTTYREIDVDFALDQIINSVIVNWRRYNIGTETATDVPYGPYENAASVAEWGPRQATFTVQGATEVEADIAAFAQDVLTRNKDAEVRARSVTIVFGSAAQLSLTRAVDLNSRVTVEHPDGTTQTLRVVGIAHTITGERWTLKLELAKPLALTPPSQTPGTGISPIPPGSVGTDELTPDVKDDIQAAYDAANQAAQDAADAAAAATTAQQAANGKNKVTYSTLAPGSTANTAGDIWFRKDAANQTIIGQWEGLGGSSWSAKTIRDEVIANLDAGKLTAGSAFTNALWVKTNLTLGDASTNGVIQSHNFAGSPVGVYIDKYGIVAKGGTITGAEITGGIITGTTYRTSSSAGTNGLTLTASGLEGRAGGANTFFLSNTGDLTLRHPLYIADDTASLYALIISGGGIDVSGDVDSDGEGTFTDGLNTSGITTSAKLHLTDPNTGSGGVDVLWQTGSKQVVANTSSRRFKFDEEPLPLDLAAAYALEPKRSHRHDSDPDAWFVSFIAEDADDLGLDPWVVRDEDGQIFSFSYTNWTVAQQAMLRDLHHRVTALEAS